MERKVIERITGMTVRGFTIMGSMASVLLASAAGAQTSAAVDCQCQPVSGQPAADVLASEDRWGNPTFIGGITNTGPDSGSVW